MTNLTATKMIEDLVDAAGTNDVEASIYPHLHEDALVLKYKAWIDGKEMGYERMIRMSKIRQACVDVLSEEHEISMRIIKDMLSSEAR